MYQMLTQSIVCKSLLHQFLSIIFTMNDLVANLVSSLPTLRLCLIFIIVLLFVRLYIKTPSLLRLPPLPPGPFGIPFLGFLPFLGNDFHFTLTDLSKRFGPIYQIFLGGKRIVVISDVKIIKEAFRQPVFSGRPDTELTKILQGYGIVNSDGALWKEQRAFLHNALRKFGAKSLMQGKHCLEHKIKDQVQSFLNDLNAYETKPFRIRPLIAKAVSNVVGSLLMNMTFQSYEDESFQRLLELMEEGFKLVTVAMPVNFIPILRYVPGVNYAYQKIKQNRQETGDYFKVIAEDHKKTLEADNIRDFVDAYLVQQAKMKKDGKESYFSEEQLIQIMNDIFSAGLETVTSTIEWAVLYLVLHPHIQEKIQNEIDHVVGRHKTPELNDLSSMPFTEATIWETLRLSNVITLGNAHSTLADATLNGYFIPARTQVLPNLYALNMDPQLWHEPNVFNPQRFLKDGKVFKPEHFIPFSVGRRMCLGDVLTKMEVFLFLTSLLQQFNVINPVNSEPPSMKGVIAASLAPKPFNICIAPRD